MPYIAVLDYDHLDNGLFLNAFAKSLARQENPGIIIHSDSKYTERVIQTGVMREEARIRAIKDLNHRLIALLADQGVSAIGLNGYQRGFVRMATGGSLSINTAEFKNLPPQPALVLSALAESENSERPVPVKLPLLASALKNSLGIEDIIVFSAREKSGIIKQNLPDSISWKGEESGFLGEQIPAEFQNSGLQLVLTTADGFAEYPELSVSTHIL